MRLLRVLCCSGPGRRFAWTTVCGQALAKAAGMSTATLAQAWTYSRYYLGAVIIGATSLEQLESNWAAAGTQLSDELLEKIDDVHRKYRNPNLTD